MKIGFFGAGNMASAIVGGGAFYLSGRIYLRVLYFAARFLRLLNRAFK